MAKPKPTDGWIHYTELEPWADNPNVHGDQQPETIAESIREFGFVDPIVIWDSKGRMVAGHGRLMAMRLLVEQGYSFIATDGSIQSRDPEPDFQAVGSPGPGLVRLVRHEFGSEAKADAYAVAANQIPRGSHLDVDATKALLQRIESDTDFDALHAIGFPHDELKAMIAKPPDTSFLDGLGGNRNGGDGDGDGDSDGDGQGNGKGQDGNGGGSGSGDGSRAPSLVDLSIPMSVAERARCHGIINLAKRTLGVTTTREAVVAIFDAYEAAQTAQTQETT